MKLTAGEHDIEIRGHRCHLGITPGDGEPVLLVMGFGMSGRAWQPLYDRLPDRYRAIWYDARGLGASTGGHEDQQQLRGLADDAAAILDVLGLATAHVVGVSMGGMIAQHLALRHRARLSSLGLIATHAGGGWWRTRPTLKGAALFARANAARGDARLRALRALLYVDPARAQALSPFAPDQLDQFSAPAPPEVRMRHLRSIASHDLCRALGGVDDLPTVVLRPDHDVLIRPAAVDHLARCIPGARLVPIPDAGHGAVGEHPEVVRDILVEHWDAVG